MLAKRIIPVLLHRGQSLYKGQKFNAWRSVGLAMQAIRIHQQRGVDELILLDIGATPNGRGPDFDLIADLAEECFSPLTVGGGVRNIEDIRQLLSAGADKISLCTVAEQNPLFVQQAAETFGSQAIVVAVDVPLGTERYHVVDWAKYIETLGAGEILLTSVAREGTMEGYDLDLIQAVAHAVNIPVIANGGCRDYDDMYQAIQAGASAVAAGALFQFTDCTPKGAVEYLSAKGIEVRL